MPIHSHGGASHDHADAEPGHTHPPGPGAGTTVVRRGPSLRGLGWRVALTTIAAAGMIVGAFLPWIALDPEDASRFGAAIGTRIDLTILFSPTRWFQLGPVGLFASVGFVTVILGLVALLGFAFRRGWLTSLAGAAGIGVFALVLINVLRAPTDIGLANLGIGLWLVLVGGLLALLGGFFAGWVVESRR